MANEIMQDALRAAPQAAPEPTDEDMNAAPEPDEDMKSGSDAPDPEDEDMKSGGSDFDESPSNFNDAEESQESEEEAVHYDSNDSSSEESDGDDNNEYKQAENNGLSTYELMRLERIRRNNERLASLGLSKGNNIPKQKKKPAPKQRKRQSVDAPRRELPGRAGRATFMESFTKQRDRKEKREEEKNPDACYACQIESGELMCCDYCRKLYHPKCHPPISPEEDSFRCTHCESSNRTRRVACGLCNACKREDDCMTCVVCFNGMNSGGMKAKCIFRRCQSWGKGVLEKDKEVGSGDEDEVAEDKNDSVCNKCKEGGDLICCDKCSKAFHSNCHKPKIYSIPEGEWTCMYCTVKPTREKKPLYKPKYGDSLIAVLDDKEVTVNVKWPNLQCLACEGVEVTGVYKNYEWTTCRACNDSYHLQCLSPPLEHRPNKWRCQTCKEKKKTVPKIREKIVAKPKNEKLFEGVHDDDCYICFNGGDLLCCDYCSKVFHMKCHIPPLLTIPKGVWKCCECAAVEYKRMMRCGECDNCLRDDCGKCTMCKDKPKFGGPGRLKQTCEFKKCHYMRLAPPASSAKKKVLTDKEIKAQFKQGNAERRSDEVQKSTKRKRKESIIPNEDVEIPKRKRGRPSKGTPANPLSAVSADKSAHKLQHAAAPDSARDSIAMTNTSLAKDAVGSKILTLISTALKQLDNQSVQKHACQFLRVFVTDDRSVDKVIQLGGLLMLAQTMYTHLNDLSVQIQCIATLTKMSLTKPGCGEAIIGSGCVALAIEAMGSHQNVVEMQRVGCALLRALSYNFGTHHSLIRLKAVEAVVSALKAKSTELIALLDGFYFLQNILCNSRTSNEANGLVLSHGLVPVVLNGISLFPEANYIRSACGILANLVIDDFGRKTIGGDEDSLSKILSILYMNVDIDIVKTTLDMLKLLFCLNSPPNHPRNEKLRSQCFQHNGLKRVLYLMESHPHDVCFIMSSLSLIADLIRYEQNSSLLVDTNGFLTIISQMSRHRHLGYIQAGGCSILRRLDVTSVGTNAATNAINLILAALRRHSNDDLVQFDGCHALLNIFSQYPSLARMLKSFDMPQTNSLVVGDDIIDTMSEASGEGAEVVSTKKRITTEFQTSKDDEVCSKIRAIINKSFRHSSDHKAQDKACEHLRKVIIDEESAQKVLQLGGVVAITSAMRGHHDKSIVQAEASATLSDLVWKYPPCSRKLFDEGCLALVVKAMNTHTNIAQVQKQGCGFFRTLSYENENHYFINTANGFETVLDSMSNNRKKPDIVKEACLFLQNMLSHPRCPPEHISLILAKDIIPIVIDGISANLDTDFVEAACGTIKNLAVNNEARSAIGKYESSISTIVAIFESNVEVCASKCALDALKVLAGNEENRIKIGKSEGIGKVIEFITSHANDPELVSTALNLILEISKGSANNPLPGASILEFVASALNQHSSVSSIQMAGCQILNNIPCNNEDEAKIMLDLVLASMKNHSEDNDIQSEGVRALLSIVSNHPLTASLLRRKENYALLSNAELRRD